MKNTQGEGATMLYLTLEDNPFPDQKYDETALLEFVRSVARRDGEDRTISELLRFQESLERLGLLWTPLDSLDKYQAHELVRNLHLELTAPGDMVYLKHSPAMRCYVVLRGAVLLTNNVLDREGVEGVRTLGPGDEFGHPFDPDLDLDKPVTNFLEYAKAPHLDLIHEGGGEAAHPPRGGSRKDGRAELLVIGRQDWISTLQGSRSNFARVVAKDVVTKNPDPLKSEARVAFNFPAKGRKGVHHEIAAKYLKERVPFCSDLPPEQVSAIASAVELRGLAVPGRVIFRRGRECDGEAYIMFTGTADQKGGDKSGDRLIKEGDLFGDEFFAVAVKDVLGTPFRTATAITRTAPSELLVIPSRECRRLQAFMALRNSEKVMAIFEKFFINLPREVFSEIATLATFRTIKMNAKLAEAGDDVSAVYFFFRGECVSKTSKRQHHHHQHQHQHQQQQQHTKRGRETTEQRYGPGHIVGWPFIMPEAPAPRRNPMSANGGSGTEAAAAGKRPGADPPLEGEPKEPKEVKKRRPHRNVKEWRDTVTATTPAQMLSVPLVALLTFLSQEALQGLRAYITLTHRQKLEETPSGGLSDEDENEDGFRCGENALGWSNFSSGDYAPTGLIGADAAGGELSKGQYQQCEPSGLSPMGSRRPFTVPDMALKKQDLAPPTGYKNERPSTMSLGERLSEQWAVGAANPVRPNSRTRWRWRVGLTDAAADTRASTVRTPSTAASRGGYSSRRSSPCSPPAVWGYGGGGRGREIRRRGRGRGRCSCPMESCRDCSASKRLARLRNTPVWAPTLPLRSTTPASAPAAVAGSARSTSGGAIRNMNTLNAFNALSAEWRPSTFGSATTAFMYTHRREDKAAICYQPGGLAAGGRENVCANTLEGAAAAAAGLSFKLWSEGRGADGCSGVGGGDGALTMTTANRGNSSEEGDQSTLGTLMGKTCFNAGRCAASSSPAFVSFEGKCGAGVAVKTATAAPTSDLGVAAAVRQLGGGIVGAGGVGSEASAVAPALLEPDRPVGRLSCTLVQLSTRAALDTSSETPPPPSAASAAAPCLFVRILGSFACEAEATTRVLNLYHSVLPANLTWLPCEGTGGRPEPPPSSFSDHLFLLRKGIPVGRISINVAETSDNGDEATGIDAGNSSSESNSNDLSKNRNATSTDTYSNANSKNGGGSNSSINNTPRIAEEGVGRGYDANIPAVFKAKGQHFAVVFALSPDRVEMEWAKQQQRQQQQEQEQEEQRKQLLESEKRVQDTHRSGGTESAGLSEVLRHGSSSSSSSSSSCSSHGSASQPGKHSQSTEGRDEASGGGELTLGNAAETTGLNDGCSTKGELPAQVSAEPASETEGLGDQEAQVAAADQGDTPGPTVGSGAGASCDVSHMSLGRKSTEPDRATAKQAGEGCNARVRGDQPLADTVGDGGVIGGAKQEPFPGSVFDELLDKSDSESSGDDCDSSSKWKRARQGSTGGGAGSLLDGSAGDAAGGSGTSIEPEDTARDKRSVLSWIISRMGLLEKVEGCYETEATAFKKAVGILEGKETALASTRMPSASSRLEEATTQKERALAGEGGGGGGGEGDGMADLNESRASRERHPEQRRPRSPPIANPAHENLACILPLYEWLSLGDGEIGAVETALRNRSISDPSEAKRAGVDPFALWTEQRARRLRTNLFNLLTAAGPREIRSRCGVAAAEDGRRGVKGRRAGVHREGGGGGGELGDEDSEESGAFRSLGRNKATKTAVRSARAAVLRQNQKLIQTEMNVRQRLLKAAGTQATVDATRSQGEHTTRSSPETSTCKQRGGGDGSVTRSPEKPALADDSGSVDGTGAWFGAGSGSRGGGGSGKKGLRHELRVQMNIERKRARLFEDIQTLPYTGTKRGILGAKGSSESSKGSRNTDCSGNGRPKNAGHQGSSSSSRDAPPAIVLRVLKVQAQKRLHGKPASSFFARAHPAGVTLAPTEGKVLDEPRCRPSTASLLASAAGVASPTTAEQQAAPGSKATVVECSPAAANIAVKPHPTPPAPKKERATSFASAASTVSIASNLSTRASAYESFTSIASDGHDTASTSVLEATVDSTSSWRNNEEGTVLGCAPIRSKLGNAGRPATLSRGTFGRAGHKGVGRKAVNGDDRWNTSKVSALHGELMLLDGCLHDHKVRTWVETTLVPAKKHQQRVV